MSKEEKNKSNKSNKKNTTNKNNQKNNMPKKNVEKEVTNAKNTKASKKEETKQQEKIRVLDTIYDEYNEDLEEDYVEEIVEHEEVKKEVKKNPKEEKKASKEEKKASKKENNKTSKEKIEKIEKKAKKKKSNEKMTNFLMTLDKNRFIIYGFITGALLTALIACIIWPDRIATLKNGEEPIVKVGKNTYTANELYEQMKDYYSVSLLLDKIDTDLLTKIYPETDEMKEEVKSNAENYFSMYEQYYGYTEEEFLKQNGFSSYDAFIEYLTLDHRRNLYLDEYIEKNISDEEIQKYYDKNVFGDINTQHILVEVASEENSDEENSKLKDEDAKKLAEEIITKLNDGTSWKDVQKEYKDKITFEDLSYQSWNASLEESFMNALKEMEDNTYSEEPVKTSYGYHIIHRIDQKEKPSLKKSKEKIIENITADKKEEDSNLLYKSLISLRNDKKIKFSDTVMKDKYEDYCKQYK